MKLGSDENGHRTIDGARWHYPKHEDPSRCGEPGCDYVMKAYRDTAEKQPRFKRRKRG